MFLDCSAQRSGQTLLGFHVQRVENENYAQEQFKTYIPGLVASFVLFCARLVLVSRPATLRRYRKKKMLSAAMNGHENKRWQT